MDEGKRGPECFSCNTRANTGWTVRLFLANEEMGFAIHTVSMLSTYGFQITCFDLSCIDKRYLDMIGRTVHTFQNKFLAEIGTNPL